jgi:hypothetical protein
MASLRKSFSESASSATLDVYSAESETETTERHDDDDEDETEHHEDDDDDSSTHGCTTQKHQLTPEERALLEKKEAKKLAKRLLKKERRKEFRREIKKAIKRDERMKCLTETMLGTLLTEKRAQRRCERSLFRVSFKEGEAMCSSIEFDEDEAPKQINDPSHVSEDHDHIPWDEWEEEPLTNWWDQPDLDEVCCV